MSNWLICLPRPDLERCMKVGTFGLNRKFVLGRVSVQDKIVCCSTKEWQVIGFGECTEPYYVSDEKVFIADGVFPDRFDFRAVGLSKVQEFSILDSLENLSFVKNMSYWAVYFRSGIVEISDADYSLLRSAAHLES